MLKPELLSSRCEILVLSVTEEVAKRAQMRQGCYLENLSVDDSVSEPCLMEASKTVTVSWATVLILRMAS